MRRVLMMTIVLVISGIVAVVNTSWSLASSQGATPEVECSATTPSDKETIAMRWHDEAINGGDLDVIQQIVAPNVVHHAGTFPDGEGPEAITTVLGALLTGFPDVQHTIEQVIADGDFVVIRFQAVGTHEGEFQGYEPTGKQVTWSGINIFRFECGRIVEEWSEVDGLGRLLQIGAVATPTP